MQNYFFTDCQTNLDFNTLPCGILKLFYHILCKTEGSRGRVRAVDRHCRKMRQKYKCGTRFFHLAKVHGDNFLSSNLNSTY